MGVDFLDVSYRIEKEFGVRITNEHWSNLVERNNPRDIIVGELHDLISDLRARAGLPVMYGSWNRLKLLLVAVLDVKPGKIRREAFLVRDLGMS